ncbi:protein of unknown function [Paenibacillus sophorae]|uniref:DUF4269 domain-containing protein n=1 Tax=Paenibacillus sophorae TaxID=1333845 RepID=A0A1H8PMH5_9BACL|nr:DUF4269 domain-containing protein [Paenibacillus sophorae]QWU16625.1 DUF4269 domain-containing protein [Paenibacillus sophorae]SEO42917.1 protein of unknown function [Paenibacillus sophorae]
MTAFDDWKDLSYLKNGSPVQREVHALLKDLKLMNALADWDPVLAGTVPLGLQVPGSDLDILCEVHDFGAFRDAVERCFGGAADYRCSSREVNGKPRIVARFTAGKWPVEIFGQPVPVRRQNGYIHMVVEARILGILGEGFRDRVRLLKADGIKTEPAFAQLLALEGDPYISLLQLERLDEPALEALCRKVWPKSGSA